MGGRRARAVPALRRRLARRRFESPSSSAAAHAGRRGAAGRVWQRHLPLWIPDLADEPTADGGFAADRAARRLRHPAAQRAGRDRRDGLLQRAMRQANDDHLSMLSALGGQIGQFMERKRVEQGLRDSEERYRSVIAALDEGIILVDATARDGLNASASGSWRASAEMLARRRRPSRGRRRGRAPVPAASCRSRHAATGEPRQNVVLGVTRGDGSQVWISMNSQPLVRFGESGPTRRWRRSPTSRRARRPRRRCARSRRAGGRASRSAPAS